MHILRKRVEKGNCDLFMVRKDKYWGFVKIYLLRPQLYGEELSLPAKSTVASIYMRKKNKTELLVISSLYGAPPPLSHIHVCDERALASPRVGNIGVLFDESLSMSS